ncbi:MAG: hypothetical protein JO205_06130 [Pseudolabrys sp.]|nr:hypothetical protein [Pseudolabrys sp.]
MQLSILIATHRAGLSACSKLAQACAWASPNIEIIIRDNSGDAAKGVLLPQFQRDNCTIIVAEPCDSHTNIGEILKLAKGEFIFILADDDAYFDHAIAAIPSIIAQISGDPAVIGITGAYAIETTQGSAVLEYKNVEADDVAARVSGYLSYNGPNILLYSPLRRELVKRIYGFHAAQPGLFSFHDYTICLLYLLNGKFARLKRLLYLYDVGPWEKPETAQQRDVSFYKGAGLDPGINKLHWLLCAFEGAVLVRNSDLFPDYPMAQRQPIADLWFSVMYQRFQGQPRMVFDSQFAAEAEKLRAKYAQPTAQMSFENMLADVSSFMGLSNASFGQRYFDFWGEQVGKPHAVAPRMAAAG